MPDLDELRQQLDEIDRILVANFEKRCAVAKEVGLYKIKKNIPVKDASREKAVVEKRLGYLKDAAYTREAELFIRNLMAQSRRIQRNVFRCNEPAPKNGNVYIVGLPGCGKSTVGRLYAREEGMSFLDLDCYIVEKTGKTVPELFQIGEKYFRDIEAQCLSEVSRQNKNTVIATGGGIVERTENIKLLQKMRVIYLYRPVHMILKGKKLKDRPLLAKDSDRIYELEKSRRPKYEQIADYKIGNLGKVRKTVSVMQKLLTRG